MSQVIGSFLVALAAAVSIQAQTPKQATDEVERIQKSMEILTDLTVNQEKGIPRRILQRADAIIVIPSLIKGGFVVGAKHGRGIMSVRDPGKNDWSSPAFVTVTGGSIGPQIGAEAVDLVLLVMNRKGVDDLLSDKFTLGGAMSVAAGPVGKTADAETDAKLSSNIMAYSRTTGLFAGASFEGGAFHGDKDANAAFYGQPVEVRAIVMSVLPPGTHPPSIAETWRRMLKDVGSPTENRDQLQGKWHQVKGEAKVQ